ncbi:CubicO group peptidase, beta-lactamase class C family [Mucilaginibacter mallensis]|uniref:CubicO group peptidase, beta-lactamase class C family n=1 Tax=Mucilaginibacter mallensis TaxID=652787 RepID=A0A1H2BQE0_MUCMA|nr:serine hydrolase [Mucilaginibacter mallensis]SDT60570.1 CubicO group peptidase, beta-lactamase class C family [Mucilaginibacter mallensis]
MKRIYTLILLIYTFQSFGQTKDTITLSKTDLTDTTAFDMQIKMEKPLTAYLQALAPAMALDGLVSKGNFQFVFYVDGKLLYTENLNAGAGTPEQKKTRTSFRVPLVSNTNEDSWGRFLWMRFTLRGGGEAALTEGKHDFRIEMRPYLRLDSVITGPLIASAHTKLNIIKPAITDAQTAIQQIGAGSGWPVSDEKYDQGLIKQMNREILHHDFKKITSIVVIKNGKLLLEEYFNGADRATLHDTRSASKSYTSALIGIAIKDHYIKNEDQTLKDFYGLKTYANYSAKKDSVKLRDLLTMSSAFNGSDQNQDSPGNEENMYPTDNWVKFALDLPMDSAKINGKQWDYFTAGVVLLGDILNKAVPGGLEKFADQNLFKPMGIAKYQWEYTPQKVVNTAGGLQMTALDNAKFGQLYKNGGSWEGKQLLPAQWVARSLSRQLPIPDKDNEYYGYLFWDKTYTIAGKSYETWYCAGNGGSKVYIFKDLALVVVVTATAYNMPYAHPQVDRLMNNYLLPAVIK